MSTWNDVKNSFRAVTNKVICKTDALAEEASLSIKKKTTEAHLAEAYERLGKITYRALKRDGELKSDLPELSEAMNAVEKLRAELLRIEADIRKFKEKASDPDAPKTEKKQSNSEK